MNQGFRIYNDRRPAADTALTLKEFRRRRTAWNSRSTARARRLSLRKSILGRPQLDLWLHAGEFCKTIIAGNGLTGGGTLAADRTLTLGTPGDITNSTTNSVTSTSHTHALGLLRRRSMLETVPTTRLSARPYCGTG
ncbi:hypothetical protein F2981_16485 [Sinorhizobium meliloti]|nr:hypothetical protein [Sinorhizobium meliloti]